MDEAQEVQEKLSNLTQRDAKILLGIIGVGFVVQLAGSRYLLNHVEKIETKSRTVSKVTQELARIAAYEQKLIEKHVDGRHLDEFDTLVLRDLEENLEDALVELRKLFPEIAEYQEKQGEDDPEG